MKRIIFGFLTFIFLTVLGVTKVSAIDGFLTVTSPIGGEVYTEGQTINITWDSSPNIDKVAIMYKSDAHHGNWVVFSTPNTKSYSWNVDVGNTTNTQFYIEIIGYETGTGSITNFGGYFTVNQKANAPTLNPTITQPTTAPTTTTTQPSNTITPTKSLTPYPTIKTSPSTTSYSLFSYRWSSTFWFSGTMTTNLAQIKDPKNVENFTIDTKYGWMLSYTETLDLSGSDRIKTLQNINKYWSVESWYIWIHSEWWTVYKEPAILSLRNENLTGYSPKLNISETQSKDSSKIATIESSSKGVSKIKLTGPAKISISPKVEFTQKRYFSFTPTTKISFHTSHKNLDYFYKVNGQERLLNTSNLDENTGEITVNLNHLKAGENLIQISYKENGKDMVLADETSVIMFNYWWLVSGTLLGFMFLLISRLFRPSKPIKTKPKLR